MLSYFEWGYCYEKIALQNFSTPKTYSMANVEVSRHFPYTQIMSVVSVVFLGCLFL